MTKFTLDANVASQLQALGQTAELCDPSGHVVGRYVPLIDLTNWEPMTPEPTEEELDRREQADEKEYTLAEVLAHLEKLK